jgi:hypothetical protein
MSRCAIFALIASTFAALPEIASGEMSGIRPEFKISTGPAYSYYSNAYPHNEGHNSVDIAASTAGTFVVVWEDLYTYQGGYYGRSNPGIWGRRLDEIGRPLGPEFRVSPLSSYAKGDAHVSSNAQGQFVVVWDDYYADLEDPGELGIVAARFNSSGGGMGLPFKVNSTPLDYGGTPKVALANSGKFMVVWANEYGDEITGQLYEASGLPAGGEFQIDQDSHYCCYSGFENPATFDELNLAVNSAGNFMVVWSAAATGTSDYAVRGRLFDPSGAPLGDEFVVGESAYENYRVQPNITVDGSDRFIVAWTTFFGEEVRARRFDPNGTSLGDTFQVNTQPLYHFSYGPGVAADAAGNFIVTWDDQEYYQIFGRRIDASGTPVGSQFRVDDSVPDYDEPGISIQKLAGSAAGEFVVAWAQYDQFTDYVYGVVGRQLGIAPIACAPTPMTGCRASVGPSGIFSFKDRSIPAQNTLTWKLNRGPAATGSDFGEPLTTDSYAFCVYDGSARPQPLLASEVPAGGACGKLRCWKEFPGGRVEYLDRQRYVGGIELVRMIPGAAGKAKAQVTGRGTPLILPDLPLAAPVTVQIQVANGECWTATYANRIRRNANGVFKASPDS